MLGERIRAARTNAHITLNQMAEATGLTASYISQLERNLTEPSISSLRKVADALHMPVYTFLEDDSPQTYVIRADKRKTLSLPESHISYEYLTPTGRRINDTPQMEMVKFDIEPKHWTNDIYLSHKDAEECIIAIHGSITVDCEEKKYILEEGDSIYLMSNTPHNIYNHTDETATAVFCATPPVL